MGWDKGCNSSLRASDMQDQLKKDHVCETTAGLLSDRVSESQERGGQSPLSFPGFYLKHMTAVCWEPTASGPDFSSDALSALSRCLSRGCSPTAFLFTGVTCKSFLSFIQNGGR